MVIKLLVVWILAHTLEGKFLSPNIMGKSLNIHPLTIIIVLLVAGKLLGVIGLILVIPIYAIIKSNYFIYFSKITNIMVKMLANMKFKHLIRKNKKQTQFFLVIIFASGGRPGQHLEGSESIKGELCRGDVKPC